MATSLTGFGLHEMLVCSNGIRAAMRDARTMEAAAQKAARFLYDQLIDDDARSCALVRVYKTHPFHELDARLREFALRSLPEGVGPSPTLRCLTLLATVGDEPAWNDRRRSVGHQAIPLPSIKVVEKAPMVAALIRAFGIDIATAVDPAAELMRDIVGKTYGVFHVLDARGSDYIPAQDFVERHGIRSVIGFGGALPNAELFAVLLFTRVTVSAASADRFRTIALDVKSRFFGLTPDEVFDRPSA